MEIAHSQSLLRLMRLALIGVGSAFALLILSLLAAPSAHAGDDENRGGLLGAVSSVVDTTTTTVTTVVSPVVTPVVAPVVESTTTTTTNVVDTAGSAVSAVTAPVAQTVETVVETVPAPVAEPVTAVTETVGAVVAPVVQPVAEVVSGGVVGAITEPVVDLVTQVPVVGGVVEDTGLGSAVIDLGTSVDGTLGTVVGSVSDTGGSVGLPPLTGQPVGAIDVPSLPGIGLELPGSPGSSDAGAIVETVSDASASGVLRAPASDSFAFFTTLDLSGAPESVAVVASSTVTSASDARGPHSPAGELCPPTALSGPGGSGSSALALAALLPLAAHRAWVRRRGPEDDDAPPAPVPSTDVSPD